MGLTKSQRQIGGAFRMIGAVILGFVWMIAVVTHGLAWLFGARSMGVESASKFVRQGSGGRFRSVSPNDVLAALQPVNDAVERAAALARRPKVMAPDDARRFLGEVSAVADEIDEACDAFQAKNYSFAHKRSARSFNTVITEARKIASDLRNKTTVTDMDGNIAEV